MTESATEDGAPEPAASTRRRTRKLVLGVVGAAALLTAIGAGWLGYRVVSVRDSLEHAQGLVPVLREQVTTDTAAARSTVNDIARDTDSARAASSDPVWRSAEWLPVVGTNLQAVRQMTSALDDAVDEALVPLAGLAGTLSPDTLRASDGRIDLSSLVEGGPAISAADAALEVALQRVEGVDTAGTIGQVQSAKARLVSGLTDAARLGAALDSFATLAPPLLGVDGPRDFVLMVQNPAEARALGGNPAALVLLTVDDGRISLSRQASSLDFPRDVDAPLPVDPSVAALYSPSLGRYVMDSTMRPDFPTAAGLIKAYWEKYIGGEVDGVISIDPVALSYLLTATGPVTLPGGEVLSADNAVPLLLSEVYFRYDQPRVQDAFFAAAASSVFDTLASGTVSGKPLVAALSKAVAERRLLLWSDDPAEETGIAGTPLSGVLPEDDADATNIGVFFNDRSSSKMDYYLDTSVAAAADTCVAGAAQTSVDVTLTSTVTPEQAASLPAYVRSGFFEGGDFLTDVIVAGPTGATYASTDAGDSVQAQGEDLGRPVVRLAVLLRPEETRTVRVVFSNTAPTASGPLRVVATPLVRETSITTGAVTDCRSAAAPSAN